MNALLDIGLSNAVLAGGLALLAYGASWVVRRPALIHGLWLLVLLKLVTPPLVHVPIPRFILAETVDTEAAVEMAKAVEPAPQRAPIPAEPILAAADPGPAEAVPAPAPVQVKASQAEVLLFACVEPPVQRVQPESMQSAAAEPAEFGMPWRPIFATLWLAGTLAWLAIAGLRIVRFRRWLGKVKPAPRCLRRQVLVIADRLGLARVPQVWLVPGPVSPMLWAFGGPPILLLPAALLARLSEQQTATLLAHELAHLRRRDHWLRGLELLATALYWWHPVLWWARRELREAEEQCCDAWVVWALPAAASAYALALVETVDFLSQTRPALPPAASGVGHVRILKRRLLMILKGTTPRALSRWGFLAVLGLGALALPLVPTWAQDDRPRKEPPGREERKPTQRPPLDDKLRADIEKARAEVAEMHAMMEKMRDQMEAAHRRLQEAQTRLAQLEGRRPDDRGGRTGEPGQPGDRGGRGGRGGETPAAPGGGAPGGGAPGAGPGGRGMPGMPGGGAPGAGPGGRGMPGMPGGHDGIERRMMDLERRMEGLMHEMQTLRHELGGRGRGRDGNPQPDARPGASPGDRKPVPPPQPPGDERRKPAPAPGTQPPPGERR